MPPRSIRLGRSYIASDEFEHISMDSIHLQVCLQLFFHPEVIKLGFETGAEIRRHRGQIELREERLNGDVLNPDEVILVVFNGEAVLDQEHAVASLTITNV